MHPWLRLRSCTCCCFCWLRHDREPPAPVLREESCCRRVEEGPADEGVAHTPHDVYGQTAQLQKENEGMRIGDRVMQVGLRRVDGPSKGNAGEATRPAWPLLLSGYAGEAMRHSSVSGFE